MEGTVRRTRCAQVVGVLLAVILIGFAASMTVQAADVKTFAPVFDSTYYADKYPDLKAAFGYDEKALFQHFVTYGMKEGRQACEDFNVQAYKARYADLQKAFGDDLKSYYLHYINYGKAEGRNGKPETTKKQDAVQTAQTVTVSSSQNLAVMEQEVVALVNADRAANGLSPVSTTPQLMAAAQARAQELVTKFDHTRPDGTLCYTMMDACGVTYTMAAENIAAGQTSAQQVETSWMNSAGHRTNILGAGYTHIGVGLYKVDDSYRYYWVEMFTD